MQSSTYEKGIVESGVKYLKSNFLPTRSFRDLGDLNAQARAWVMTEAGTRVHGTTRERPLVLFESERALLQPLPAVAPDLGTWHRVVLHRDCHMVHDRALYSGPFTLVGKTLWLRATDAVVALYEDYRHLYTHALFERRPVMTRQTPLQRILNCPEKPEKSRSTRQLCLPDHPAKHPQQQLAIAAIQSGRATLHMPAHAAY